MTNGTPTFNLQGSIVALVTPMFEDGSLDLSTLRSLVDWHIAEGTAGIVIAGTSGEAATLSNDEYCVLIQTAVDQAAQRIPIIAGAGSNATAKAIELTQYAKQTGAAATLQVVPYYNKPSQEGLFLHFAKIAQSVDLPLILYNVPSRTIADMHNETISRLSQIPQIVGVKDATADICRGLGLIQSKPAAFSIYSGDDASAISLMLMGAQGIISVTANVAPRAMSELCKAALAGDLQTARAIHMKLLALHQHLFVEANPIPVKWALHQLGKIPAGIRLPLTPLAAQHHATVRSSLHAAGLQEDLSKPSDDALTVSPSIPF